MAEETRGRKNCHISIILGEKINKKSKEHKRIKRLREREREKEKSDLVYKDGRP